MILGWAMRPCKCADHFRWAVTQRATPSFLVPLSAQASGAVGVAQQARMNARTSSWRSSLRIEPRAAAC